MQFLTPWTRNLTLRFSLASAHVPLPEVIGTALFNVFAVSYFSFERNASALCHVPSMIRLTIFHFIITKVLCSSLPHALTFTLRFSLESWRTGISTIPILVSLLRPRLLIISKVVLHQGFFNTFTGVGWMQGSVLATPQGTVSPWLAFVAVPDRISLAFFLTDGVFFLFGLIALGSRILRNPRVDHHLRDALTREVGMQSLTVGALPLAVIVSGANALIPIEHRIYIALFLFGAFLFGLSIVKF